MFAVTDKFAYGEYYLVAGKQRDYRKRAENLLLLVWNGCGIDFEWLLYVDY